MPYDTQTGEYTPLTASELSNMIINSINERYNTSLTSTDFEGSNFQKVFYSAWLFMLGVEQNFALANNAIVQQIQSTGFTDTTITPTSSPFVIQKVANMKAEDDTPLFKFVRLEPTTTAGRIAIFVAPHPEHETAVSTGYYDLAIANLFLNETAIATDVGTRSTTPVAGAVENPVDISITTNYTTPIGYRYYLCTPTDIASVVISVKTLNNAINVEQIRDTFYNAFETQYSGQAYVPEQYLSVSDVPTATYVSIDTTVGGTTSPKDEPIQGLFLALDKANITVQAV